MSNPHSGVNTPKIQSSQNGIDPELAAACGIDPPTTAKPRTTFTPLGELIKTPPAENWIVKSLIPASSIIVLFGNSGDGKTFVAIDLLCHIAAGIPWRGNKTRQGPVLYLAGEGQHGIIRRFKAWFEAHPGHEDAINNILIRTIPAALCDPAVTADLLAEIAAMPVKPVAIGIDTLARNFGPGDENSTRDMSAFVAALDALRTVSGGATIILPHHSGHGDKTRARGSSVLKGAIDTEFCIERKDTRITMTCSKMKDADEPPPLSWLLTRQDLPWADSDGVPMNSAVLVPTECDPHKPHKTQNVRVPAAQRIAVDALRSALIRDGVDADSVVTVTEDQWRQAAYSAGISSSDAPQNTKRMAFNRARDNLIASNTVQCMDGRIWIPVDRTDRTDRTKQHKCADVCGSDMDVPPAQTAHTPLEGCADVRVCGIPEFQTCQNCHWFEASENPNVGACGHATCPSRRQGQSLIADRLRDCKSFQIKTGRMEEEVFGVQS